VAIQLAHHLGATVFTTVGDLEDVEYGAWQGLTPAEAEARDPKTLQRFLTAPSRMRIPDGETFAEVQWRAVNAIRMLASRHASQIIAAVAHTEVNRLEAYRFDLACGGRTRVPSTCSASMAAPSP
jgi:broad specificity phosphatase PhoE